MLYSSLFFFLSFLIFPSLAKEEIKGKNCDNDAKNFRCVRFERASDGNTVYVTIPGAHPLFGESVKVEVRNLQAPKPSSKNNCERFKGKIALNLVTNFLIQADKINLENVERAKDFGFVADVLVDDLDLSFFLSKNGMAYVHKNQNQHPKLDWCPVKVKALKPTKKPSRSLASESETL